MNTDWEPPLVLTNIPLNSPLLPPRHPCRRRLNLIRQKDNLPVIYGIACRDRGRAGATDERRSLDVWYLMRFKQVCNHPSHWSGDGVYAPADSGKFARLAELCAELADRQERVLIFTQFREIIDPLHSYLTTLFKRPGLILHGGTPVKERQKLVDQFQAPGGPPSSSSASKPAAPDSP